MYIKLWVIILLVIPLASAGFGYDDSSLPRLIPSTIGKIKTFIGLEDTPSSYGGEGGNCVKVNVGETALEFGACGAGGSGENPFDQVLNESSNVTFNSVNITGANPDIYFTNTTTGDFWDVTFDSSLARLQFGYNAVVQFLINGNEVYSPNLFNSDVGFNTSGNVTASNFCNATDCYEVDTFLKGGHEHDQFLNTSNAVEFNNITIGNTTMYNFNGGLMIAI